MVRESYTMEDFHNAREELARFTARPVWVGDEFKLTDEDAQRYRRLEERVVTIYNCLGFERYDIAP